MKFFSKTFSFCSLTLLTASATFANQDVYVPTFEGGITASIGTWYVVPSANNTNYARIPSTEGTTDEVSIENASAEYDFGYEAALGYIFNDTANGIELTYRGLDADNDAADSALVSDTQTVDYSDTVSYNYNALDLLLSQYLDIGRNMQLRFVGGASYANIDQTQELDAFTHSKDIGGIDTSNFIKQESKFDGVGPRLGIDARYEFGPGFGILGGASVAYLLGELEYTGDQLQLTSGSTTPVASSTTEDLDNHAVTNLRANLALDYVYFFSNEERSTIGIELGYQTDYYADALYEADVLATTTKAAKVNSVDFDTTSLTFSGPYLNIKGAF